MSESLEQLAASLDSMPQPSDIVQKAQITMLKAQGKVLAHLQKVSGDVAQKREVLATCDANISTLDGMLGERHEGIIILRKMMAIATAIVEGDLETAD